MQVLNKLHILFQDNHFLRFSLRFSLRQQPLLLQQELWVLQAEPAAEPAEPEVQVRVLEGGTKAWIDAGLPTDEGLEHALCEADDVWYKPYEHKDAIEEAMRDYLTWEVALVEQIERDGDLKFSSFA